MGIIINMLFWGSTLIIRKFKNVKADASVPGVFIAAIVVISLSSIFLIIMIFKMPAPDKNMITVSFVCILASIFVIVYLYDAFSRIIQDKMQALAVLKEKDIYSSTGNIAIDSVINYKFRIAEENNVSVHLDIAIPEKLDIADDDIVYVSLAGGRLATRKKDKSLHGIGIKSVCSIVEKYDGQFDYEYNDNVFMVNILMYV